MSDRRVRVTFEAEVSNFQRGTRDAAASADQLATRATAAGEQVAQSAERQRAAWSTVGPVMMATGAAMVAGVGVAVKKFADFDKAMSSVQAATHETTGNMALMREAAISAGADTAFSAEEAAQGIEELAKAGVSTAAVLNGGLTGALSLAAAGNLGVGASAEIAASAMTQFKLSGDQIPHLADLLAAGAGKAQGSVQDLGAALNQSGLVAASTGLTIEESTGALAAFASAGLTGSDAGTSFKTMLQSLNPNSKAAANLMDDLGIKAYDASGEFIGMSEYAGVLQGALKDMSSEQRNATLKTLFGSDAVRAANVIYEQGADGIQKWEDAVNDAGYAAQTAAIMQDNLAGDVEKLGGSLDSVFLKSGSGANEALRGMAQGLEGVVDTIGTIPAPILSMGAMFTGVAGGALLLGGGLATALPKILETRSALRVLAPAGGMARFVLGGVGIAAAGAAGAFVLLQAAIAAHNAAAPKAKGVEAFVQDYNQLRASAINLDDTFKNMEFAKNSSLEGKIGNLGEALGQLAPKFGDVGGHLGSFGATVLGVENGLPAMRREIEGLSDAMATAVQGGDFEGASKVFRDMVASAEAGGKGISDLTPYMDSYLESLRGVADQYGVNISEAELMGWAMDGIMPASVAAAQGAEKTATALEGVGLAASGAVKDMDDFLESLFALGNVNMSARDAAAAYEAQLDSLVEAQKEIAKGKMGKTLNKTKDDFDLATEAGRLANEEFQGLAKGGMAEVEAMSKQGAGQGELQKKLSTTYADLVKAGDGFGLSAGAAKDLAREVLGVPDGVSIKSWMETYAQDTAEDTKEAVNGIPDMKNVKIIVTTDGSVKVTADEIQGIKDRTISTVVSDEGTILQVQGGIDGVSGKTEFILVNDDGTVVQVQERINSTTGKTEYIRVTDDSTVAGVQQKINTVKDGSAKVKVTDGGSILSIQGMINRISGGSVTVGVKPVGWGVLKAPGKMFGGQIPRNAAGARLPSTGPGTDRRDGILGITPDGTPLSWLDGGEWVINRGSSLKHDSLLGMINRDDPQLAGISGLAGLSGLAAGGQAGRSADQIHRITALQSTAQPAAANFAVPQSAEAYRNAAPVAHAPARQEISISFDIHGATDGPAVARQVRDEIGWALREQGLGVNL